jgi:hypothetical protein
MNDYNRIPPHKQVFTSTKIDYKPCDNCTLPVGDLDSLEKHCIFCKTASHAEFKLRTKPKSTSCLGDAV